MNEIFQECTRCVIDAHAADVVFDSAGRCNYCTDMLEKLAVYQPTDPKKLETKLGAFIDKVRRGAGSATIALSESAAALTAHTLCI